MSKIEEDETPLLIEQLEQQPESSESTGIETKSKFINKQYWKKTDQTQVSHL